MGQYPWVESMGSGGSVTGWPKLLILGKFSCIYLFLHLGRNIGMGKETGSAYML